MDSALDVITLTILPNNITMQVCTEYTIGTLLSMISDEMHIAIDNLIIKIAGQTIQDHSKDQVTLKDLEV